MTINFKSDTVTKPSEAMLQYMFQAEVGDDVFGDDPTVKVLEEKIATMFAHEAALFCPSGTMSNQIAIGINTQSLDEIICDNFAHIYWSETGGYAHNSRVSIRLIPTTNGILTPELIEKNINANYDWQAHTSWVSIENTGNKTGGNYYSLEEMKAISHFCRQNNLKLHLDGARIFNAIVENNYSTLDIGNLFDTISVCFSKGLGAPIGSALIGNKKDIEKARRLRKVMGGGMRQVGYLAAACIYALENNISLLKQDHIHAKLLAQSIQKCYFTKQILPVKTNIVIAEIHDTYNPVSIVEKLEKNGVLCVPFGGNTIRWVTHLDITSKHLENALQILESFHTI